MKIAQRARSADNTPQFSAALSLLRARNEVNEWKKDGPVRLVRKFSSSRWSPEYSSVAFKAAETSELVVRVRAEGAEPCAESGQEY